MIFINIITRYISKWDITNLSSINEIFIICKTLTLLPDISEWDTYKVSDKK